MEASPTDPTARRLKLDFFFFRREAAPVVPFTGAFYMGLACRKGNRRAAQVVNEKTERERERERVIGYRKLAHATRSGDLIMASQRTAVATGLGKFARILRGRLVPFTVTQCSTLKWEQPSGESCTSSPVYRRFY